MPLLSRYLLAHSLGWWVVTLFVIAASPFAGVRTGATGTAFTATTVAALIADINTANANPAQGPYTINLVAGGAYTLVAEAATGSGTGLPTILSGVDLTIVGNGATIQRNGATTNLRLFLVNNGGTLQLTGLTLRNGLVAGAAGLNGGNGTGNTGGPGVVARGGAIYNNGTLVVRSSVVAQNGVSGGAGGNGGSGTSGSVIGGVGGNGGAGGDAAGGAIFNGGKVTITNSTFADNTATGGIGGNGGSAGIGTSGNGINGYGANGGSGQGGAIASVATLLQPVTNSTITTGSATGGVGGTGRNVIGATGAGAGGGAFNGGSGLSLTNTILAGNSAVTGGNCAGNIPSDGGNNLEFSPATSCGFTINNQVTDPVLGALVNHGGPTATMALGPGSAAVGKGDHATCAGVAVGGMDQRGLLRLTPCSIGAFEPQSTPFPTLDALSSSSGSTTGGSSVTVTGMGFASGATILFGTASASPPGVVTGTTITATVPAHSAGTVDVTVTNPDGQAATLNLAYTFGTVKALPDPRSTAQPIMTFPKPLPDLSRPTGVPSSNATPNPLPPHR